LSYRTAFPKVHLVMNNPVAEKTGYRQRNFIWQAIRWFSFFRGKPWGIHHPCSLL